MKDYLRKYTEAKADTGGDFVRRKKKKKKPKRQNQGGGKSSNGGLRIIDEDYDWRKDTDKTDLAILNELKREGATIVTMEEALKKRKADEEEEVFRQARMLQRNDGSGWVMEEPAGAQKDSSAPMRHDSDDDASPTSRRRHDSDAEDASPAQRRRHDSDLEDAGEEDKIHRRHGKGADGDGDQSPRRKKRHDSDDDMSPIRARTRHAVSVRRATDDDDDLEVRRRSRSNNLHEKASTMNEDGDLDSTRRRRGNENDDLDVRRKSRRKELPGAMDDDGDLDSVRRRRRIGQHDEDSDDLEPMKRRPKKSSPQESDVKMGLLTSGEFTKQNLAKEKAKMDELKSMDPKLSGAGAKTVFRDKRGRKLESLAKFQAQQSGIFVDNEESGMVWGKGLAQEEEVEREKEELARLSEAPFARSRDDEIMNAELRQRERWGDPMLKMMRRKKRKKKNKNTEEEPETVVISSRPYYQGQPWPNRYGVRPGYRWDGIDRSNGWENKRMLHINNMGVRKEQGYRWGASAM